MEQILHFKTHTQIKSLVGKDLINEDDIAVVELVKNSYDAQSPTVSVTFTNFSENKQSTSLSKLIITDSGSGMDEYDIRDKWLNIAYSEKKLVQQTQGAYLAGNKGVGRFSCDRLGKELDLLTRKADGIILHLKINWEDFERDDDKDLTIQTIPVRLRTIEEIEAKKLAQIEQFPKTGTILVMSKLRAIWDESKLKRLKTSLEKFLNPNQLFSRDRFRIYFSVPDLASDDVGKPYPERINVEIENQIFEKLKFNATYIEAKISNDSESITTNLYHEGEKVFELVQQNQDYSFLAGTYVVIYFLNTYKKAYFKRQTGVRLKSFGSIFLFLNGFRVAPYGDSGNDWLGLDIRKAQGTRRFLSSRDMVGRIEISNNGDRFVPISNRTGLKNTAAFTQLREEFFLDVLRKLERFVVEGLSWDSVPHELRQEVSRNEGLDWNKTTEVYVESQDRKRQRIALSIMTFIGVSHKNTIEFWFNPALLDNVYESRQDEVKKLLDKVEGFDNQVDLSLKKQLSQIRAIIEQKEEEAREAKKTATDLKVEVAEQDEKIAKQTERIAKQDEKITKQSEHISQLESETETYRAQTLFLQQVSSFDVEQLISYHHQIKLDSSTVENYLTRAIKALRDPSQAAKSLGLLQKANMANKRISAVAQFASKANFRSGTKKELTDIPAFFEQYLARVATDYSATNLKLDIMNNVTGLFELKASRIELSILIDNIVNNAKKAHAKMLIMAINQVAENRLQISFIDDGNGLSKQLANPEAMFEMGVTTTSGSGLGLFHAKTIIDKLDGKITAIPQEPQGMEIRLEMLR